MPNRNKRKERKMNSIFGYMENKIKIRRRADDAQNLTMDITTTTINITLPTNMCLRRIMIGGT